MSLKSDMMSLRKVPPIPKGWFTAQALAKTENVAQATATKQLRELIMAGVWEKKEWPIVTQVGGIRNYPIYRRKP